MSIGPKPDDNRIMNSPTIRWSTIRLLLQLLIFAGFVWPLVSSGDPRPLLYPGKANIGYLLPIHARSPNGSCISTTASGLNHFRAMAGVWTVHMINQARAKRTNKTVEDIGIYIYDSCDDPLVATRQTLKMVSHVQSIGGQLMCSHSKSQRPLIGVVVVGDRRLLGTPLRILDSYDVPTMVVEQELAKMVNGGEDEEEEDVVDNFYSVAPNVVQLNNAAMSLATRLQWRWPSVVVSDSNITFDQQTIKRLAMSWFEEQASALAAGAPTKRSSKTQTDDGSGVFRLVGDQTKSYSSHRSSGNTILFLTNDEAVDLADKLLVDDPDDSSSSSTKTVKDNVKEPSNHSWIIVTAEDVTTLIKKSLEQKTTFKDKKCKLDDGNGIFLVNPLLEDTTEFEKFFETIVRVKGKNSDQPLIAEFAKQELNTPKESVSGIVKSVWSLVGAYSQASDDCQGCKMNENVTFVMNKELNKLDKTIKDSHLKHLDGTRLTFDDEKQLKTIKYQIRLLTKNCEIIPIGFYAEDSGLKIDENLLKSLSLSVRTSPVNFGKRTLKSPPIIVKTTTRPANVLSNVVGHESRPIGSIRQVNISESPAIFKSAVLKFHRKQLDNHQSDAPDGRSYFLSSSSERELKKSARYENNESLFPSRINNDSKNQFQKKIGSLEKPPLTSPLVPANLLRSSLRHSFNNKLGIVNSTPNSPSSNNGQPDAGVTRRRHVSLTAWLGNSWSMAILASCIAGVLITLYVQTFLLMKSCEGSLKKANQGLAICHLTSIMATFLGAAFYVFFPTPFMCSVRTSTHNLAVGSLFGSLLLRAMHIRAQKSIGLGGRSSKLNQMLTMFFIIGFQLAVELQQWRFESPIIQESAHKPLQLCSPDTNHFLTSQCYLSLLIVLLLLVSWSARRTPFNQREGNQVFLVAIILAPVHGVSLFLHANIHISIYRDIIISMSMVIEAFTALLGLFVPLLVAIHKFGVFMPGKTGSYADSLSTIFTSFRPPEGDNFSLSSRRSREGHLMNLGHGSAKQLMAKDAATAAMLQQHHSSSSTTANPAAGANFFTRVSPNHFTIPCVYHNHQLKPITNAVGHTFGGQASAGLHHYGHHHQVVSRSFPTSPNGSPRTGNAVNIKHQLIPNPLYEGVPGFRSAYP